MLRTERDAALRASWTDALTGVPNRRYVMARLDAWIGAANTEEDFGDHSLAVLDLDHFKRVNDIYGHDMGDRLLISFCRDVVSHIRNIDMFGRVGGEEFLLFMPNTLGPLGILNRTFSDKTTASALARGSRNVVSCSLSCIPARSRNAAAARR